MPTYSKFLGVIFFPEYKLYLYLRSPRIIPTTHTSSNVLLRLSSPLIYALTSF